MRAGLVEALGTDAGRHGYRAVPADSEAETPRRPAVGSARSLPNVCIGAVCLAAAFAALALGSRGRAVRAAGGAARAPSRSGGADGVVAAAGAAQRGMLGDFGRLGGLCRQIRDDAERARLVREGGGLCPRGAAFAVTNVSLPTRSRAADEGLLAQLRDFVDRLDRGPGHPETADYRAALEDLERLQHVDAKDILAFRETWTDGDTEILRRLDNSTNGFTPGVLSSEALRGRLPSARDFASTLGRGSLAIVGSGSLLRDLRMGPEIDGHEHVVRFNDHIGSHLDKVVTGTKMTIHVSCGTVRPLGQKAVTEIDLETDKPWASYCFKMHAGGGLTDPGVVSYFIRPTAICAMGPGASQFTRGFLFYWFVGRLFADVDMYGFGGSDHYDNSATVWEKYLPFEHLVYDKAGVARGLPDGALMAESPPTYSSTTTATSTTVASSTSTATSTTILAWGNGTEGTEPGGCEAECILENWAESCRDRILWSAAHRFAAHPPSACRRARQELLRHCPACARCRPADLRCRPPRRRPGRPVPAPPPEAEAASSRRRPRPAADASAAAAPRAPAPRRAPGGGAEAEEGARAALGCEAVCTFEGAARPCRHHVREAALEVFRREPETACEQAYTRVRSACSACAGCSWSTVLTLDVCALPQRAP